MSEDTTVQKRRQLVERLFRRTNEGKLAWVEAAAGRYKVDVGERQIVIYLTGRNTPADVHIDILDQWGGKVEEFFDEDVNGTIIDGSFGFDNYYELLLNLYDKVKRLVLGSDQILDDIVSALEDPEGS